MVGVYVGVTGTGVTDGVGVGVSVGTKGVKGVAVAVERLVIVAVGIDVGDSVIQSVSVGVTVKSFVELKHIQLP